MPGDPKRPCFSGGQTPKEKWSQPDYSLRRLKKRLWSRRVQSTYIVECRVSTVGIHMISGSIGPIAKT